MKAVHLLQIKVIVCLGIINAFVCAQDVIAASINSFDGATKLIAKKDKDSEANTAADTDKTKSASEKGAPEKSEKDAAGKSQAESKSAASEGKPQESEKDELLEGQQAVKSFSGNASWYGIPFHGKKTASGEIFDMNKLSAAHLTLPLPTRAIVEDPRTGNAVIVKVNDRGPYVKTRVMDLSREAARELGTLPRGVAYIDVTVLESKRNKNKKG